jgi:multidrug efflux pump subunit AcrB
VDRSREITVTADASDKAGVATILDAVQKRFDTQYKVSFPGVTLKMGGEFAEFGKLLGDILRLFWIGLFLIYVILGAQFKSYLQPLIMIFSIPFAIMGSLLFLVTSGTPISTVVLYAGVALTGISVNDSIVLISFINALRRGGKTTAEAVVEACQVRLRPIILTSVTTIGGLLPMALGIGGKSEVWAPMASTIIFGLFFSTVGTLLVIPCIYGILDDIMARFGIKMKLEGD